ncbi:hypothetical protein V2J94_05040 [Streptomyces sp. DSM 41524]|uniref:Uncharacterized protein n=1 Tax=Streptomyces asiaticus subsp. ignotus TaxID=3098222 RepID=A0ABU7PS19_9ACTN|nr:hypothetical protein [Streptomyces sp. DSM 41524]
MEIFLIGATGFVGGAVGALYHAVAGETPNRWLAERVADDLGRGTRGVGEAEAAATARRGYRFGGIR